MSDDGCKRRPDEENDDSGFLPGLLKSREAHKEVHRVDNAVADLRRTATSWRRFKHR